MKICSERFVRSVPCVLLFMLTPAGAVIPNGPYFGQKPPGMTPVIFAPGIVSLPRRDEVHCVFSPNGNECFITVMHRNMGNAEILYMRQQNGLWARPTVPSILNKGRCNCTPAFSADGRHIFFISSRRPPNAEPATFDTDIWMIERSPRGVSKPQCLASPIYTIYNEWAPALTADGTLYFSSYRPGGGTLDIYRSAPQDGEYLTVENLGAPVNNWRYQSGFSITLDGKCIIFAESDPWPNEGPADLYVTFLQNGAWTKPKDLGPKINTKGSERSAVISPDGKYLFFSSEKRGSADIYWVDMRVLDSLRPDQNAKAKQSSRRELIPRSPSHQTTE